MFSRNHTHFISVELAHYLRALPEGLAPTTAAYVAKGADLVTIETIVTLRELLPEIRKKLYTVNAPAYFIQSVEVLAVYFEEMLGAPAVVGSIRQQVAFALLYFLKGYDRIPDSIPEIGYVDDAAVVSQVIENHRTQLRDHWVSRNWGWPAGI